MTDVPDFQFVPKDAALALEPAVTAWLDSIAQLTRAALLGPYREEWNRAMAELREAYVDTLPTSRKAVSR
jgi:hypothetical protein